MDNASLARIVVVYAIFHPEQQYESETRYPF